MSDVVTSAEQVHPDTETSSRRRVVAALARVGVISAVFAAAGAAGGWLWHAWWAPAPVGVAVRGDWIPTPYYEGHAQEFSGVAEYVVIGFLGGLVLAVIFSIFARRHELITLLGLVIGSGLAAWLSYLVGTSMAPPDPGPIAARSEDLTEISGTLALQGSSPFIAWPLGALLGLAVIYFVVAGASEVKAKEGVDPHWMPAPGAAEPLTARSAPESPRSP